MRLEDAIRERMERDPDFARLWIEEEPKRAFQQALIGARINANMTQHELAAATGIGRATIARLEAGEGNPTVATLQKLAAALAMHFQIDAAGITADREPAYVE